MGGAHNRRRADEHPATYESADNSFSRLRRPDTSGAPRYCGNLFGFGRGGGHQRATVLAAARAKNPERFATTNDPKILATPETAWINRPAEKNETELAA